MNTALQSVWEHMLGLGTGALAHANWHSNYWSPDNKYWSELSVLQAAHAAEIFIKARIAQEHPLLIFEQLPRSAQANGGILELEHLFERGRTFQYVDLPERLWATTGITLPNLEKYQEFGRMRNVIQHFAPPPNRDFSQETREFIFQVIDPFINACWGLFAIDYNEDHEPYVYLIDALTRSGVLFLVSPEAAHEVDNAGLEWPKNDLVYQAEMKRRFAEAAKSEGRSP